MSQQQYDNTNRGVLFLNDRKEQDTHPDRKGSINIEGKEYWLSAWDKETSKGETISLSVTPKEAQGGGSRAPRAQTQPANRPRQPEPDFSDDEIGF
jgi:hypothetical protein